MVEEREVRKLLGISPGTLQNLRVRKILPFTRVGGIIYHDAADIQAMLDRKNYKAVFAEFFSERICVWTDKSRRKFYCVCSDIKNPFLWGLEIKNKIGQTYEISDDLN